MIICAIKKILKQRTFAKINVGINYTKYKRLIKQILQHAFIVP